MLLAGALLAAPPNHVDFDLYAFSQNDGDRGGDPLRNETFLNTGVRTDARIALSDVVGLWHNATFAVLNSQDPIPVPSTISNATVLSASGTVIYLETANGVDLRSAGDEWVGRAGLYYHHQSSLISGGADLVLEHQLAGGDASLALSYAFRLGFRKLHYWDGTNESDHAHPQPSHTIQLSYSQTLSKAWRAGLSAAYARQDGILSDTFAFVAIYDALGRPKRLTDEALPKVRNRGQLNGRLRYSPEVGMSFGLDLSGYLDDWDVRHFAFEPSFELAPSDTVRFRLWTRVAVQGASKYFLVEPTLIARYQTQDSDLGEFWLVSPGGELVLRIAHGEELDWRLKLGIFGFTRTDGVWAVGGHSGVSAEW